MKPTFSRWEPITATTNSGKQQFVCLCCGRISVSPDKTCPKPAIVVLGGDTQEISCAVWEKFVTEKRRM